MTAYGLLGCCGLAAGLSAVLVPGVRAAAIAARLFDPPGPLKIHTEPIPRLGGVGFVLAFLIPVALTFRSHTTPGLLLLPAVLLVWITGVVDDIRSLPASLRLACHTAAGLLVYRAGLRALPDGPSPLDAAATCCVVIACVNAFNFLDGADGLAAGTAVIAGLGFAAMSVGDPLVTVAGATLASACAGFLLFNFPPARVFMGDSGSTVIGLVLAICALRSITQPLQGYGRVAATFLILALPLADFGAAIFRRVRRGGSPFVGDRSHFYDVLMRRGWSSRAVALSTYAVQAALTAIAIAVAAA